MDCAAHHDQEGSIREGLRFHQSVLSYLDGKTDLGAQACQGILS